MPNPNLSIMVVDDARFSSALIGRSLQQAGYGDIRYAGSAGEALAELARRPASVLLVDWMMPEMDGLELTAQIRQLDDGGEHYTYIILLTGSDGESLLGEAFERGVDDFVNKATVNEQLVPRVLAAERVCATLQRLLQEKHRLAHSISHLEQRNLVDSATGLGNLRYLRQRLAAALRQLESRGGALCFLLIRLEDFTRHDEAYARELLYSVGQRLRQLVRPLDVLVHLDGGLFAVLAMVDDLRECSPSSFRRLYEALNLKALKTSEGFLQITAAIAMLGVDSSDCPLDIDELIQQTQALLGEAHDSGRIASSRIKRASASAP